MVGFCPPSLVVDRYSYMPDYWTVKLNELEGEHKERKHNYQYFRLHALSVQFCL